MNIPTVDFRACPVHYESKSRTINDLFSAWRQAKILPLVHFPGCFEPTNGADYKLIGTEAVALACQAAKERGDWNMTRLDQMFEEIEKEMMK